MSTILPQPEIAIAGQQQTKTKGHRYLFFLKGGISVFLMWWILEGTNFEDIFFSIRSASVPLLVCAFCLPFLGYYLSVSRWRILLRAQGIIARMAHLVQAFMISVFFNNFLPSTIGGDVYRVYESTRLGVSTVSALAIVFVDRFLGLLALLVLTMIGLIAANPFADTLPFLTFWVLSGFAGVVGVGVFLVYATGSMPFKISEGQSKMVQLGLGFANKISNGFFAFQGRTDMLVKAFGLSLLLQGNVVLQYFVLSKALHFSLPLLSFFLIIPLALFVMLLPVSINGIGLRESVFVLFLVPWGIDKPEALALAWLAYGSLVTQGLLGGLVYACRK